MCKYIKVDWPESQQFENNKDCYVWWDDQHGFVAFVPENIYNNWKYPDPKYPIYVKSNTGEDIVINKYFCEYEGNIYWKDKNINKGDDVLFYSKEKGYWTNKCIAASKGFPEIFEGSESPGIDCEIIGVCDLKIHF